MGLLRSSFSSLALTFFLAFTAAEKSILDHDFRISDVSVLLPQSKDANAIEYTIKAYGGCFTWKSRNKEIVSVQPIYQSGSHPDSETEACTTSAILRPGPVPLGSPKVSAQIIASDTVTNRVLRCEVFVDQISTFDIIVRTHSLYKDEEEILQIEARSSGGDTFSTVTGLKFQWEILPENLAQSSSVIQLVPWKDSAIDVADIYKKMEQRGFQTGQILVRGLQTGRAKVVARLVEEGYNQIETTVNLLILEPLLLLPEDSPLYVTPRTTIQYTLVSQLVGTDQLKRFAMPNPLYQWTSENSAVGSISSSGLFVAHEIGRTVARVEYLTMPDNHASSSVQVVLPGRLKFEIIPATGQFNDYTQNYRKRTLTHSNWYLVTGREYFLRVAVYETKGLNEIYTASHLAFAVSFGSANLTQIEKTDNSEFWHIRASGVGVHVLNAALEPLTDDNGQKLGQRIMVNQEITITPPVTIIPPDSVVLPAWPAPRHTFALAAQGGSGEYVWFSSNATVATVSVDGLVGSGHLGATTITAADPRNSDNRDSVIGRMATPEAMSLIAAIREAEVGACVFLPIMMKDALGNHFDNCSLLQFEWELESPYEDTVFQLDQAAHPEPPHGACHQQPFLAVSPGHAIVKTKYKDQVAETAIFAFRKLALQEPASNVEVLVALGSSADFIFTGGPRPWYYDPNSYFQRLTASQPALVQIRQKTQQSVGIHAFTVTCLAFGEINLTLSVGNTASLSNPHPAVQSITVAFACQPPVAFLLHPASDPDTHNAISLPTASTVEGEVRCVDTAFPTPDLYIRDRITLPTRYQLRNNISLPLNVTLLDARNRRFLNASSLQLSWVSSDPNLAFFVGSRLGCHNLLNISIHEGSVKVGSSVTGYDQRLLASLGIGHPAALPPLGSEYTFALLHNVELRPQQASIFFHPQNRFRFQATAGSGSYHWVPLNRSVLTLYSERNAVWVDAVPLNIGASPIRASDVCLGGGQPSEALAIVSPAGAVEVVGEDVVEQGSMIELSVVVRDLRGNPFSTEQFKWMALDYVVDEALVTIERTTRPDVFRVVGLKPGVVRVTFSVQNTEGRLASRPHQLYVFAPFRLIPPLVVLVPGGQYQVRWEGGPPLRTEVSYRLSHEIAEVGASGIVSANTYGEAQLHATLFGFDATGSRRTFGANSVRVKVTNLPAIRIDAGADVLYRGEEMTVRIADAQHDFPFVFTHLSPLNVEWTVVNEGIVSLLPILEKANVSLEEEASFSCRIVGKGVGKTLVTARVRESSYAPMVGLTAHLLISVVEPLQMLTPSRLLLPPNSRYQIRCNQDQLTYRVLWESSLNSGVSVDRDGLITTTSAHGMAIVLVMSSRFPELQQTYSVVVEVKAVSQLQIHPAVPVFKTMPVGTSMRLNVVTQDEKGTPFSTNFGVPLTLHTNNLEVASVSVDKSQDQLIVLALKAGHVGLHLSLTGTPTCDDLIKINVTQIISPLNPVVHLGGSVRFTTHLRGDYQHARWTSDNPAVVELAGSVATAKSTGSAAVVCNSTDYVSSTHLAVVSLSAVVIDYHNESLSNIPNDQKNRQVVLPLLLFDERQMRLRNSESIDHQVQVVCSVSEEDKFWVAVTPIYDAKTSTHSCLLTPQEEPPKQLPIPPTHITLRVTCSDKYGKVSVTATQALPFRAAFRPSTTGDIVLKQDKSSHSELYSERVTIWGAKALAVRSADPRLEARMEDSKLAEYVKTLVLSTSEARLPPTVVTLTNAETGQRVELQASGAALPPTPRTPTLPNGSPAFLTEGLLPVVVLVALLAVGWFALMNGFSAPRPPAIPQTPRTEVDNEPRTPVAGLSPAARRFLTGESSAPVSRVIRKFPTNSPQ